MSWKPAPRPGWVDAVNALGDNLGDAGRTMVSLAQDELLAAAAANTGCDDYGDDWFRHGLSVLLQALEEEARLTLLGRLLARAEIQRILQNRLAVEATLRAHPEIEKQEIRRPIVVTGLGRSGTTLLHELLALDPANRVPVQWELMYSAPPPESSSYATDPRIERVRREIRVMDEADPAFPSMHELAADLPTECIYVFAHQFATDMFVGEFHVPSYAIWTGTTDLRPAYAYHRRFLQLLQWRHRGERWALKAPSHLGHLEELFATYPDARVVVTHRDPLRVVGSLASLMATLHRMRSDHVDHDAIAAQMAFGFQYLTDKVMEQRSAGAGDGRIADVRYADLVRDPVAVVRGLYERWNLAFDETFADRIRARLAKPAHGQAGGHRYSFTDTGLDRAEQRTKFDAYMKRYGIPEEV
jgi:hypothetical protein